MEDEMRLVIISGRSGSGKSAALNVLEDLGFYCIDNLPLGLLPALTEQAQQQKHLPKSENEVSLQKLAVSIDARNVAQDMSQFPKILSSIEQGSFKTEVLYLDASKETLMQRFSSTRRKHPLTNKDTSLAEAIEAEQKLLHPISDLADLNLDTTRLSVHELRSLIKLRIFNKKSADMALLFQSFGFKGLWGSPTWIPVGCGVQLDPSWIPVGTPVGSQLDPSWISVGFQLDPSWIPVGF